MTAKPKHTSPFVITGPLAGLAPKPATPAAPEPVPGDLFKSWRGLEASLGQTMPYHLNRAVQAGRLMRKAATIRG